MAANASVQKLGLWPERHWFSIRIPASNQRYNTTKQGGTDDKATEIISSSSDSGSIRRVKTVKPNRNALKTMSDLDRKIYKAK